MGFLSGCLSQNDLPILQLQFLIKLRPILAVEVQHLVGLTLVTKLLDLFWCHLMAVDGSPDGELALHVLIAVVGTVIRSCAYPYLTTALWALTDGGVEHYLSFHRR